MKAPLTQLVYNYIQKNSPCSLREVFREFEKSIGPERAVRVYNQTLRNDNSQLSLAHRIFNGKKRIIVTVINSLALKGVIEKSADSKEPWNRIYKIAKRPENTKLIHKIYDFINEHPCSLREVFREFEKSIEPDRATRTYNHTVRKKDRFRVYRKSLEHRIFNGKKRILIKTINDLLRKGFVETSDNKKPWDKFYSTTDKPYVSRGYISCTKQESKQESSFPMELPVLQENGN